MLFLCKKYSQLCSSGLQLLRASVSLPNISSLRSLSSDVNGVLEHSSALFLSSQNNLFTSTCSCRECQNSGHDYYRPPTSPSPNKRKTLKLCQMSSSSMTPQETQADRSTSASLQVSFAFHMKSTTIIRRILIQKAVV